MTASTTETTANPRLSSATRATLYFALLVLLAMPALAFGTRFGLWSFMTAFAGLPYVFWAGYAAALAGIVALLVAIKEQRRKDTVASAHAIPIALAPLIYFLINLGAAQSVPPIHDITTSPDDPPMFSGLADGMPERSLEYDRTVYEQQLKAYPDLNPVTVDMTAEEAVDRAARVAEELGWTVLRKDTNVLEAVDTTFWFGFKDDVIVRVRDGQLDVRSVSRVGRSDLGKNAARVRSFLAAFTQP